MDRFFNTSGPCDPEKHYMIDPAQRFSQSHIRGLIRKDRYFILHAPRQTGKTTMMHALARTLAGEGQYAALYINVEAAQAARDNVEQVNRIIISECKLNARLALPEAMQPKPEHYQHIDMLNGLREFFGAWCRDLPLPLVLFMDEVDALIGDGLLTVLRQLRSGYNDRPHAFPKSVCLVGVRDIRDYRIFSNKEKKYVVGGSAFNIKETSLVMENFDFQQVVDLFAQHTAARQQLFEPEAIKRIYYLTNGQPWLVNALGRELCDEDFPVAAGLTVTEAHVKEAADKLILRRDVHLDQLSDKLTEPRVVRVIEAILLGESGPAVSKLTAEDQRYVIDLGLVRMGAEGLEIANPLYREVIPRELTSVDEGYLGQNPLWYRTADGKLDMEKMLHEMVAYYRQHHEIITRRKTYTEAAHHLVFMTWLHRIVNSGGSIEREYAVGLGRMDLHITYGGEHFAIELKLLKGNALEVGIQQLAGYLGKLGLSKGYLILFQRSIKDLHEIGRREQRTFENKHIEVLFL